MNAIYNPFCNALPLIGYSLPHVTDRAELYPRKLLRQESMWVRPHHGSQGLKFLETVINCILQVAEIKTCKLVKSVACILNQQLIKFRLLLIDKIGGSA
jgi:hypothetical protein